MRSWQFTIGHAMILVAGMALTLALAPLLGPVLLMGEPVLVGWWVWSWTRDRPHRRAWFLAGAVLGGAALALGGFGPIVALLGWAGPIILALTLSSIFTLRPHSAVQVQRIPTSEFLVYALLGVGLFGVPVLSVAYLIARL